MNKNIRIIDSSTSKLVWLIQRPSNPLHTEAVAEANRRLAKGAKAAAKLEAALAKLAPKEPVAKTATVTTAARPTVKTAKAAPKERTLTAFQRAVLSDPETFGEGFGKGKARTAQQRKNRQHLYSLLAEQGLA